MSDSNQKMGYTVNIWIDGTPQPKARARVTMRGRKARAYTPRATADWESYVRQVAGHALRRSPCWEGPVRLRLEFLVARPSRSPKRLHPAVRPDVDNCGKAAIDALNGLLFRDDGQIVELVLTKRYAGPDETEGVWIRGASICTKHENEGRRRHQGVTSG